MKRDTPFALRGAKCTRTIAGAPLRAGRWLAWGMALLCSVVTQAQTWTSQDIGAVALAGSATTSGTAITLRGSGADIWDNADAFRFHHQSMTGDGEIFAQISNRSGGAEWQKAGLMIRESLAPNARNVLFLINGQTVRALQYRTTTGGPSAAHSTFDYSAYQQSAAWLRLVRRGSEFISYRSTDGVAWVEGARVTLDLPATALIGLAVTSHDNSALFSATFEATLRPSSSAPAPAAPSSLTVGVNSTSSLQLRWTDNSSDETGFDVDRSTDGANFTNFATIGANTTTTADDGRAAGTTYYYRVRARRSEGSGAVTSGYSNIASARTADAPTTGAWQSQDIGLVGAVGSSSETGGVVTMRGSGSDIWGAADEFHFRSQSNFGDGELVARLTGMDNTDPWAKAGLMIRSNLQANAPNTYLLVTPSGQLGLQRRYSSGAETTFQSIAYVTSPVWLRLVWRSFRVTVYYSYDGLTWQGGQMQDLGGPPSYIGLAVTSHSDGTLCSATFDRVQYLPSATSAPPVAPGDLTVTAASSTSLRLQWTDNSSDETGFQVERSPDGAAFSTVATMSENANSHTDTGLAAGSRHFYRVRAVRGGVVSAYSNVASGTTSASSSTPAWDPSWHNQDIGAVAAAGSAVGKYEMTLKGSGEDVWGTSDEFHFQYKAITGDGEVWASFTAIDNTNLAAKAGVMIRAGLEPNAPNVFLAFNPSFAATLQHRSSAGAGTVAGSTAWKWPDTQVRLVRAGNVFSAYTGVWGQDLLGTVTVAMPSIVYAGMAVTSHSDGVLCSATIKSSGLTVATLPSPTPPPIQLTATLRSEYGTHVLLEWEYLPTNNTYFDVERSLDGVNFSSPGSTVLQTWREGSLTAGRTYYFRVRARAGSEPPSAYSKIVSIAVPGGTTPPPPSGLTATVLSATSIRLNWTDNSTNEPSFTLFRKRDGFIEYHTTVPADQTTFTDTGLHPGTIYAYEIFTSGGNGSSTTSASTTASTTTPPPWSSADVGVPATAGRTTVSGDTLTVAGAGDDIWDVRDQFHFYSRDMIGDGDMVVRIHAMDNTHVSAKAGLMLRAGTGADATNVFIYVTPDFRVGVQRRLQSGALTQFYTYSSSTYQGVPSMWLRLERLGGLVRVQFSSDMLNWGHAGTFEMTLPTTIRAGIAVTSHSDGVLCNASFSNLRIYWGETAPPPPTPPPPPPPTWTRTAIGSQGVAPTSSTMTDGTVTVSGAGTDIWGSNDGFVFFNQILRGNGSIVARVQSLTNTHEWAKAGVMIRAALRPESPHVFAYLTPNNGAGSHVRATDYNNTSIVGGPWWASAPYFLRVTRNGSTFTTDSSPDGTTWSLISTHTVTMPTDVYIGLAVTSHDPGQLNETVFTNVAITAP